MDGFRKNILTILLVVAIVSISWSSLQAQEYAPDSPAGIIQRYGTQTVDILGDTDLRQKETLDPLREALFDQLAPIIDFRLMTRSALGPQARQTSDEKLQELTNVFKPLVVRLYADRLFKYMVTPENPWTLKEMKIINQQFRGGKRYALVTSVATVERDGTVRELSMDFKMIKQENGWKVYDLVFENVSLVENYRSQFTSILANTTVDGLIEQLRQKLESVRSDTMTPRTASDTV